MSSSASSTRQVLPKEVFVQQNAEMTFSIEKPMAVKLENISFPSGDSATFTSISIKLNNGNVIKIDSQMMVKNVILKNEKAKKLKS